MAQMLKMWLWGGVFLVKSTAVEEPELVLLMLPTYTRTKQFEPCACISNTHDSLPSCTPVSQYSIAVGTSSRSSTLRACQQLEQVLIQDSACFYAEVESPGNLT